MSDRILHKKFNCRRRCFETEVFCKKITGLKSNKKTIKQTNKKQQQQKMHTATFVVTLDSITKVKSQNCSNITEQIQGISD